MRSICWHSTRRTNVGDETTAQDGFLGSPRHRKRVPLMKKLVIGGYVAPITIAMESTGFEMLQAGRTIFHCPSCCD